MTDDKTTVWLSKSTKTMIDKPDGVTWDYWLQRLHETSTLTEGEPDD